MLIEESGAPLEGREAEFADTVGGNEEVDWISLVREAYKSSTDYLDANYRKQFERNLANFKNTHPPGSKYLSEAYKSRSRLFRPKIRTAIRGAEAAFAEAMFATRDVITIDPINQSDKRAGEVAEVWQSVLNHRLKYTMPWFRIAAGAFQETKNYGIVCSRQDWDVSSNGPEIELLAIENFRFDPGASWVDPVNTSPYFIELIPMYAADVEDLARENGWNEYTREEIITYGKQVDESKETLRSSREGNRQDPKDADSKVNEFQIVWVHRNFMKYGGADYEFYTLSTNRMLSEPVEVTKETHPIGRPYKIGVSNIEAHRVIPSSDSELAQDLQSEANDVANQRIDNIRLVLNKGYFVNRRTNTDLATLTKSYPGRLVLTDDHNAIRPDEMQDVTSSSYAEQDRINHDIDDILGGFSGSSVATNRQLNETVGGMQMFQQAGNKIQGYSVRTFVETWVEPVLNDVVKLMMAYESDRVLSMFMPNQKPVAPNMGQMAQGGMGDTGMPPAQNGPQQGQPMAMPMPQPVGLTRQDLMIPMSVGVSVGLGPLDPKERAKLVVETLSALGKMAPWAMGALDIKALSREIFGVIGYRDGSKFFTDIPDQPPQPQPDPMIEVKREDILMRRQIEMARLQDDREFKSQELQLKYGLTDDKMAKLDLETDKHNLNVLREMGNQEKIKRDREEMLLKQQLGEGI